MVLNSDKRVISSEPVLGNCFPIKLFREMAVSNGQPNWDNSLYEANFATSSLDDELCE